MRRSIALLLVALTPVACGGRSPQDEAVDAIRSNALVEWPYSDADTVDQMTSMCRSLASRPVAELLDAFAGQWSGSPSNPQVEHDYGIVIRYSIEGVCPQYRPLVRALDYKGHPGWEGVYYGDERS